jgi:hypothetical protein
MSQLETGVQTHAARPSVITWRRAHWLVGTLTLLLFPLAGLYMRYVALVPQLEDAPRLVYRSRFLFLLFIALVNLAMTYASPQRFLQRLGSAIVLAAPLPLIASFLFDPARGVQSSPWTVFTMRVLFLAAVLLALTNRPWRRPN